MAQATLIEPPSKGNYGASEEVAIKPETREGQLVAWVITKVDDWKRQRDSAFDKVWAEYYRLWRGRWLKEDMTRNSERARIVTPALAQALEMTVAELEEAVFGREAWIDILDTDGNPDHKDADGYRRTLLDDLAKDGVPSAVAQSFMLGGLYGTLAAKVVVEEAEERRIERDEDGKIRVEEYPVVKVYAVPIPCSELVPDPEATKVDDMLGIAHDFVQPKNVLLRVPWGVKYAKTPAVSMIPDYSAIRSSDLEGQVAVNDHSVRITEWHGLVPVRLLIEPREGDTLTEALLADAEDDGAMEDLVEALVVIADGCKLLMGIANPYLMKDRSIVATAFEKVPGRFWGRGVMEKGYNPQKALDGEVRMRMDVMAIVGNPMMGVDLTALPRGFDMRVRPGKVWGTNGKPADALHPIAFAGLDPNSFSQTAEMERMVQMGTGAMDTATPLAENRRNETFGGASMIAGTFVKRSKRALRHLTSNFIEPLVQKIVWRKMQYDSVRYKGSFSFRTVSTLGIVAREMESQQMTQMLALVPQGSPAQMVLIKAIFDGSASPYKAELNQALEQMMTPDPAAQQKQEMAEQLMMAKAQAEVQKLQGEVAESMAKVDLMKAQTVKAITEAQVAAAQPGADQTKLQIEVEKLYLQMRELDEYRRQIDVSALKAHADVIKATRSNKGSKD